MQRWVIVYNITGLQTWHSIQYFLHNEHFIDVTDEKICVNVEVTGAMSRSVCRYIPSARYGSSLEQLAGQLGTAGSSLEQLTAAWNSWQGSLEQLSWQLGTAVMAAWNSWQQFGAAASS